MCVHAHNTFIYVSNLGKHRFWSVLVANSSNNWGLRNGLIRTQKAVFCPGVLAAKRLQRYIRLRKEPWVGRFFGWVVLSQPRNPQKNTHNTSQKSDITTAIYSSKINHSPSDCCGASVRLKRKKNEMATKRSSQHSVLMSESEMHWGSSWASYNLRHGTWPLGFLKTLALGVPTSWGGCIRFITTSLVKFLNPLAGGFNSTKCSLPKMMVLIKTGLKQPEPVGQLGVKTSQNYLSIPTRKAFLALLLWWSERNPRLPFTWIHGSSEARLEVWSPGKGLTWNHQMPWYLDHFICHCK